MFWTLGRIPAVGKYGHHVYGRLLWPAQERVKAADVFVLGTPDYHGGSGALKNFTDHFWKEFTGKLFVPIVASHEKASQSMINSAPSPANAMPGACLRSKFRGEKDVIDGQIASDALRESWRWQCTILPPTAPSLPAPVKPVWPEVSRPLWRN